jgi:hypothetical protein
MEGLVDLGIVRNIGIRYLRYLTVRFKLMHVTVTARVLSSSIFFDMPVSSLKFCKWNFTRI